jgi:hypothetical protein
MPHTYIYMYVHINSLEKIDMIETVKGLHESWARNAAIFQEQKWS